MALNVQPYLFFEGRCEEALEFYKRTLGAEVIALMRSKDSPDPNMRIQGREDKIIHAMFRVGESTLLASDGQCLGAAAFKGFSLSITASGPAENQKLFTALGEGGQVLMPLMKTFFSPSFGMLTDRFGVSWMLYVPVPSQGWPRTEALARQLEATVRAAEATLARLSEADTHKPRVSIVERFPLASIRAVIP